MTASATRFILPPPPRQLNVATVYDETYDRLCPSLSLSLALSLRPWHTLCRSRARPIESLCNLYHTQCRRLEKAFRAHVATAPTSTEFSTAFSAGEGDGAEETKNNDGPTTDANRRPGGGGGGGGTSVDAGGGSGDGGGRRGVSSVAYQPTGGMVLEFHSYEVCTMNCLAPLLIAHPSLVF